MHSLNGAFLARATMPNNGEAETTGRSLGSWDQTESDKANRSDELVAEQEPRSSVKRLADVTAKLAMHGYSLYPLTDGTLLVTRWNLSKTLPSVNAAERFLQMVGGAR